jgi:hypothetical protein
MEWWKRSQAVMVELEQLQQSPNEKALFLMLCAIEADQNIQCLDGRIKAANQCYSMFM